MKIREVTYSRGETINTGNFNSVRLDFSATAVIDDGETADEAHAKVREFVLAKVTAEASKHRNRT